MTVSGSALGEALIKNRPLYIELRGDSGPVYRVKLKSPKSVTMGVAFFKVPTLTSGKTFTLREIWVVAKNENGKFEDIGRIDHNKNPVHILTGSNLHIDDFDITIC